MTQNKECTKCRYHYRRSEVKKTAGQATPTNTNKGPAPRVTAAKCFSRCGETCEECLKTSVLPNTFSMSKFTGRDSVVWHVAAIHRGGRKKKRDRNDSKPFKKKKPRNQNRGRKLGTRNTNRGFSLPADVLPSRAETTNLQLDGRKKKESNHCVHDKRHVTKHHRDAVKAPKGNLNVLGKSVPGCRGEPSRVPHKGQFWKIKSDPTHIFRGSAAPTFYSTAVPMATEL